METAAGGCTRFVAFVEDEEDSWMSSRHFDLSRVSRVGWDGHRRRFGGGLLYFQPCCTYNVIYKLKAVGIHINLGAWKAQEDGQCQNSVCCFLHPHHPGCSGCGRPTTTKQNLLNVTDFLQQIFPEVGAAGVMVESHHQSPPPPRTAVVDDSVRVAPNTPKTSTNNTANRFEL